jgi:hypothetical protein
MAAEGSLAFNMWPAIDYSRFLSAAVDHVKKVAPGHGVHVDEHKVGLIGHSMGGAGVLCAAAKDCKSKVAACVALNPGGPSNPDILDRAENAKKYAEGVPHSGEFGEGTIPHLADVTVPTFIYGSQAEYNCGNIKPDMAVIWPFPPSQFKQLGAAKKELYVDNLIDNPGHKVGDNKLGCQYAHVWLFPEKGKEHMRSYGDGKPLAATLSFLRRHLVGEKEPVMERPANAKEWEVVGS